MKWLALLAAFFLVKSSLPAQVEDKGTANSPRTASQLVITGKVLDDGNSPLSDAAAVRVECGSESRARAYTGAKGDFSITLTILSGDLLASSSHEDAGTVSVRELQNCEIVGEAAGYKSEHAHLFGTSVTGMVDVGTIVLRPILRAQSFDVSVTSLQAPDKAKAAFEKGEEQERKGKWTA